MSNKREYKKVYRVIRDGSQIPMQTAPGWNDAAKHTLYEGDIIYAQDDSIDVSICLLGMYNNGRWVDLSDTGNFVTLSFNANLINHQMKHNSKNPFSSLQFHNDKIKKNERQILNLKKIVSETLVSGSMLTFRECMSVNTNILEDITLSYRRDEKLNQIGI